MTQESTRLSEDSNLVSDRPEPPFEAQKLSKPGLEEEMVNKPQFAGSLYKAAGKLEGRIALITGGDSGIGRAVAVLFAREGADVAITYLPEEQIDADETKRHVEAEGRQCLAIPGDLRHREFCESLIDQVINDLGAIDILVSNAAHQNRHAEISDIDDSDWMDTFRTNVDALFFLTRAAVPRMRDGSSIIATSSETGLFGNKTLLDYSATKGAVNAFVKSLAQNLIDRKIRVNAVAPGPVWTPLNVADKGQSPQNVAEFGQRTPMGRPAQPEEVAPAYVFFASNADSSYITGHILPLLGGEVSTS